MKTHFLKVVKRVRAVPDPVDPPAAVAGTAGTDSAAALPPRRCKYVRERERD